MSVEPVAIAESAEVPVSTEMGEPLTVTPSYRLAKFRNCQTRDLLDSPSNQNEGVGTGIVMKSMSPVYNVLFTPPSVKTPPKVSAAALGLLISLVSQKDISGDVRAFPVARLYQNGLDCVLASGVHARPITPATAPLTKFEVTCDTATVQGVSKKNEMIPKNRQTNKEFDLLL
jgi:hypothetical protein